LVLLQSCFVVLGRDQHKLDYILRLPVCFWFYTALKCLTTWAKLLCAETTESVPAIVIWQRVG